MSDISTPLGQIHGEPVHIAPLLSEIAAQAAQADRTRSLSPCGCRRARRSAVSTAAS